MRVQVMCKDMRIRQGEYERIRSVLDDADADEPLTAREILQVLEEHGEEFDSAHRVATVLGRRAQMGDVEVIRDQPYRYRFRDRGN
jgi:predicted Zn-ribbon and HTH transcriptional regulator